MKDTLKICVRVWENEIYEKYIKKENLKMFLDEKQKCRLFKGKTWTNEKKRYKKVNENVCLRLSRIFKYIPFYCRKE